MPVQSHAAMEVRVDTRPNVMYLPAI